mgnify:CR=1 FL=1
MKMRVKVDMLTFGRIFLAWFEIFWRPQYIYKRGKLIHCMVPNLNGSIGVGRLFFFFFVFVGIFWGGSFLVFVGLLWIGSFFFFFFFFLFFFVFLFFFFFFLVLDKILEKC